MTPSERLKGSPPDEVIVHELGHLVIGVELGLPEGGIEFTENHPSEVARAYYNRSDVTPIQIIIRGLAGMYCQALCFPKSIIDDSLRAQILKHGLFLELSALAGNSPIAKAIRRNGFIGDWRCILHEATSNASNSKETLRLLHKAHGNLISIAKKVNLPRVVLRLLADVKDWMNTDNEDMPYAPAIIYSVNRARLVLRKSSAATARVRGRWSRPKRVCFST